MTILETTALLRSLEQVFRECFFDDTLQIDEDMDSNDVDGWDSLSHVRLLMMIERHFDIELAPSETARLANIGDLLRLVGTKLG